MLRIDAEPKLASLTSLHLGGRALALVAFSGVRDLDALPETLARIGGKVVSLGGGTNILAPDEQLPVTLLHCEMRDDPEILDEQEGRVLLRAAAGMKLPRLLAWCSRRGLSGLEGMAGRTGRRGRRNRRKCRCAWDGYGEPVATGDDFLAGNGSADSGAGPVPQCVPILFSFRNDGRVVCDRRGRAGVAPVGPGERSRNRPEQCGTQAPGAAGSGAGAPDACSRTPLPRNPRCPQAGSWMRPGSEESG